MFGQWLYQHIAALRLKHDLYTQMKKLTILLLLLAGVSRLHAQQTETMDFVRAAIALENDTMKTYYLRDSAAAHFYPDWESDSMLLEGLVKEIGKAEVAHLLKQRRELKNSTWKAQSPNGAMILDESYLKKTFKGKNKTKNWETFYSTHKAPYYEVSQPLFTSDKKYAVVYIALQCGVNCGHGGASLYVFEDGKWKIVRNIFSWINN